jgi:hypothetical protein
VEGLHSTVWFDKQGSQGSKTFSMLDQREIPKSWQQESACGRARTQGCGRSREKRERGILFRVCIISGAPVRVAAAWQNDGQQAGHEGRPGGSAVQQARAPGAPSVRCWHRPRARRPGALLGAAPQATNRDQALGMITPYPCDLRRQRHGGSHRSVGRHAGQGWRAGLEGWRSGGAAPSLADDGGIPLPMGGWPDRVWPSQTLASPSLSPSRRPS